jgi:hypothetical protein
MAWRIPAIWDDLEKKNLSSPEGSTVPQKQKILLKATHEVLTAVAEDVRQGLLETVGVKSDLSLDGGRCSMVLELPEKADTEKMARAIDLENIEAWNDEDGKVHIAVSPWFSTKEVDQTVLSAVKVVHVLLGLHATNENQPRTLKEKIIASISEIIQLQKSGK